MNKQLVSSGAPWEKKVGYSRAVRIGQHVYVAGTTASDEKGEVVGVGDAYLQTKQILNTIKHALGQAGADITHVVRSRIYVSDIETWPAVGKAHAEVFGLVKPAATMVEVSALIDPDMLVEIEVDAYIT